MENQRREFLKNIALGGFGAAVAPTDIFAEKMRLIRGGIKPGITYGATDDLGFNVVENPVHVHHLNATILHLLGFDHTRLTYRFQGRDFRLTDVHGEVVNAILA